MRTYIIPELFGVSIFSLGFSLWLFFFALVLATKKPALLDREFTWVEDWFRVFASHRWRCVMAVGVGALLIRAAFLPVVPPGLPEMADEFAYLLGGETFAAGRLTNPPHPMWEHFETVNQIQKPTYQSKYPVAQSLVLAAGMILGGHPWFGVWVSCALMCMAVCWMLQGWLPPSWALLGALMVMARFCTGHAWSTYYMGGAAAAFAGALVLGALPRLMETGKTRFAWVMGCGLVLLANSRPWEGFVLGLGVGAVLLVWMIRQKILSGPRLFAGVVLPLLLLLALGAGAMGIYFKAVTGDPLLMPYRVFAKTYDAEKAFIWQQPDWGKTYRHPDLKAFHHEQARRVEERKQSWTAMMGRRLYRLRADCLAPGLGWAFLALPFALKPWKNRILVFLGVASLPAFMLTTYFFLHYFAPVLSLLYALALTGLRRLRTFRVCGRKAGAAYIRVCAIVWIIMLPLQYHHAWAFQHRLLSGEENTFRQTRARIIGALTATGKKQLIIVSYGQSRYRACDEWVYNAADIDHAPVVWARDMGPEKNRELIRWFGDRGVWLLEVRPQNVKLEPYPEYP